MTARIDGCRDLLDDRSGRYVIVHVDEQKLPPEGCLVYDRHTGCGLLEEDDDLYIEFIGRLMEHGALLTKPNTIRQAP
jgi:hypothetical protein